MKVNKAKSRFIKGQVKLILFAFDEKKKATEGQINIVETALDLCYSKGVVDYLESKLK